MKSNLELIEKNDDKSAHAKYVEKENRHEGLVLKRHLENMVARYGANYTTQVIVKVLEEEIKAELKKQRAVNRKVG